MRRRLPDRRRRLCAAAGRRAAAQAARDAHDLSRSRRRRTPIVLLHDEPHGARADRRARAPRRRTAGECAAARRQRGDAGRARSGRRRVRLWRDRRCAFSCARKPRHDVAGLTSTIALAEPILAGLGFGAGRVATIETDDPVRARRDAARDRAARRRAAPGQRSSRSATSATCCALRCANCITRRPRRSMSSRCPKARRSARSRSMSRAARSVSPASPPARPARCPTIRSGRLLRFAEDACVQCGLCKATCPEKVITLAAAARLPRRDRAGARAQGRRAVLLHPLRQAVRREEHDRARRRQARRQALDVPEFGEAARRHQDVRGLPRHGDDRGELRSVTARRRGPIRAPRKIICASATKQSATVKD